MFQYISFFQGFIAVTDSGRPLCFHKPGSPGSNARLISVFVTYVQIMKSEPELNTLVQIKNKHSNTYFVAFPGL